MVGGGGGGVMTTTPSPRHYLREMQFLTLSRNTYFVAFLRFVLFASFTPFSRSLPVLEATDEYCTLFALTALCELNGNV